MRRRGRRRARGPRWGYLQRLRLMRQPQAKAAALFSRSGVPLAWKAEAAAVPRMTRSCALDTAASEEETRGGPPRKARCPMHVRRAGPFARASFRSGVTLLLLAVVILVLAPSALARTTPLHMTIRNLTFTSFACTDPVNPLLCDVTTTGEVNSNLSTSRGSADASLVVDFSPGFDALQRCR